MASNPVIERASQISERAFREIEFKLEPWFRTKFMNVGPAPVPGSGIQFDTEPQPGDWLDYETTGADAGGFGSTISNVNGQLLKGDAGADAHTVAETIQATNSSGNRATGLVISADASTADDSGDRATGLAITTAGDIDANQFGITVLQGIGPGGFGSSATAFQSSTAVGNAGEDGLSHANGVIALAASNGTNAGSSAQAFGGTAEIGGGGNATGIAIDSGNSGTGAAVGANIVGRSRDGGAGPATGMTLTGLVDATSSGDAVGANILANNIGTASGTSTGLIVRANNTTGGTNIPAQFYANNVLVMQVDEDGTIHVLTGAGTALVADL